MSFSELFSSAEKYIVGIGVPIALFGAGLILSNQYSQGSKLGEIDAKIGALDRRLDDKFASLDKNMDKYITTIVDEVRRLDDRLSRIETDPNKMLSSLTGIPEPAMRAGVLVTMRDGYYLLPKTQAALSDLENKGYTLTRITPTVRGFRINQAISIVPEGSGAETFSSIPFLFPNSRR